MTEAAFVSEPGESKAAPGSFHRFWMDPRTVLRRKGWLAAGVQR